MGCIVISVLLLLMKLGYLAKRRVSKGTLVPLKVYIYQNKYLKILFF